MHEHIISTVIYFCMIIVDYLYLALSRFQKMDHIISLDLDEYECIATFKSYCCFRNWKRASIMVYSFPLLMEKQANSWMKNEDCLNTHFLDPLAT